MNCDEAASLISQRVDSELAGDDAAAVALGAHLAECADCRATAEAVQLQDATLVRAFAPRRAAAEAVADRVTAALAPPRPHRAWRPVPLAAAIAAAVVIVTGTLVATLWRRGPQSDTGVITAQPIALVTLSTGRVFTCPSHAPGAWRPVAPGAALAEGALVRTAP